MVQYQRRGALVPVLAVNAGSTSVKYKLFDRDSRELLAGHIETAVSGPVLRVRRNGTERARQLSEDECSNAVALMLAETKDFAMERIGFRIVHGGELFTKPVQITDAVLDELDGLGRLAPLHNPPAVAKIRELLKLVPGTPLFAVFDTAFHATLEPDAFLYSIPYELYQDHGIRKFGFHGISHRYVSDRLGVREPAARRQIICHLGGGASITAVRDGESVETSMGFTPLAGLTMATRSGDLDAGVVFHLMDELGYSPGEVRDMLNNESGLLGLSGDSPDMRALLEKERAGSSRAGLAVSVYVRGIQRYIGAYAAVLGGVDVLAFTGGVGAASAVVRSRVCRTLGHLGIHLDDAVNDGAADVETRISSVDSVPVWVVPTDEELQICRDIAELPC